MANTHFWLVLTGQLLYSVSMWIAGVQQAGMWHAISADGSLTYTFMESLIEVYPYYWARAFSGVIYIAGVLLFVANLVLTARKGKTKDTTTAAANAAGA
jgi:cytochrome c oxidase cbb3-type subunit I